MQIGGRLKMSRKPAKFACRTLLDKIASLGCLQELEGFCKAGIEMRYRYTAEEQRAIDEKRVELMQAEQNRNRTKKGK